MNNMNWFKKIFDRDDVQSSYYENIEEFGDYSRVFFKEFKTKNGRKAYKLCFINGEEEYQVEYTWDKENNLIGYSVPCIDAITERVFFI